MYKRGLGGAMILKFLIQVLDIDFKKECFFKRSFLTYNFWGGRVCVSFSTLVN